MRAPLGIEDRTAIGELQRERLEHVAPKSPIPTQRCVGGIGKRCRNVSAKEHQTARAVDDGLVSHESLLRKCGKDQCVRRRGAAEGDLLDHPEIFLAVGPLRQHMRPIAELAHRRVGYRRVARRARGDHRIVINHEDVGGGIIRLEVRDGSPRRMRLLDRMIGILLANQIVATLQVRFGHIGQPCFIEILPHAQSGMIPERIHCRAQRHRCARVSR